MKSEAVGASASVGVSEFRARVRSGNQADRLRRRLGTSDRGLDLGRAGLHPDADRLRLRFCARVFLFACHGSTTKHSSVEPVRTATVHRGTIAERVLLTGDLRAASAVDLNVPRTEAWQLTIRWLADDGAMVKAGDRVLEFDNSAVTAQLEEKQLALLEAEMTFRGARDISAIETENKANTLHQAQIALQKATVHASVPADLLAAREAQDRQLEKKRAEVALEKAEQELDAQKLEAALELKVKQIELDKSKRAIEAAERTIGELVLTAPRDGVIVIDDHPWEGRKFHLGDSVQPGMTIVSLPDMSQPMEVHSELSDVDDGRVGIGAVGTCTLDAYPTEPIACTVRELTPVARTKGETSLRRAFAVVLSLAKTEADKMRPGMSVKVELRRDIKPNVLIVPRGAVIRDGVVTRVRVANGGARDVTLGACDAQGCAIDAGLADGDVVVIGGGA